MGKKKTWKEEGKKICLTARGKEGTLATNRGLSFLLRREGAGKEEKLSRMRKGGQKRHALCLHPIGETKKAREAGLQETAEKGFQNRGYGKNVHRQRRERKTNARKKRNKKNLRYSRKEDLHNAYHCTRRTSGLGGKEKKNTPNFFGVNPYARTGRAAAGLGRTSGEGEKRGKKGAICYGEGAAYQFGWRWKEDGDSVAARRERKGEI